MDEARPGTIERLSPLVRRLLAPNPSPFTFTGTQTHIVGRGEVAVIDPGPDSPAHIEALLRATAGERTAGRAMVPVGMSADDCRYPLLAKRREQCIDMFRNGWAGVDHRYLSRSYNVGLGSREGKSRWIGRQQPAHQRAQPFDLAGPRLVHQVHLASMQ